MRQVERENNSKGWEDAEAWGTEGPGRAGHERSRGQKGKTKKPDAPQAKAAQKDC